MTGPTRSRVNAEFGQRRDTSRPPAPEPLPAPVVDNHCHLDIEDGLGWLDPTEALALATQVGVPRIVQIGCDLPGARLGGARLRVQYDAIVAGVAHPPERGAASWRTSASSTRGLAEIERLAGSTSAVRAIGETGLDYFRTGPAGVAAQQAFVRGAHRARQAARQDARHPRPRRARGRARDARRRTGRPTHRLPLLLRRRRVRARNAWTGAPSCRSRARSRSRTRRTCATPWRWPRSTGSWWRPTRRS